MTDANRLTSSEDGMVIACPDCDKAGSVYTRHHENTRIGDPDDPYACGKCRATFERFVKREAKRPGVGGPAPKYSDLTLEDVGLEGMEG